MIHLSPKVPRPPLPSNPSIGVAALTLILILSSYYLAIENLYMGWQREEYSYGILIPPIALLIAWHRLAAHRPVLAPSWWGILVLFLAEGLQLVGRLSAFATPSEYALIIALLGVSLSLLGTRATYVMLPAFIYLLFAVPLPRLAHVALSQDLQLISSTIGVWCLDLVGIPVFQEGNVIDLGSYKLQVAEACNGLRYLFPLMSFSFLIAYMLKAQTWKRAVIFLSAIPIAVGMNSLRIALIGITVDRWGIQAAEGFLHLFEGWVFFILCVTILLFETTFLLRLSKPHGRIGYELIGPAQGRLFTGTYFIAGPVAVTFILSLLFAGIFSTNLIEKRAEIIPSHPPFSGFPVILGDWKASPYNLEAAALGELKLDDYWLADYRRNDQLSPVTLYIAYYESQRAGSSAHSPANCIPGGGWQIVSNSVKTISISGGQVIGVSRLLIQRASSRQLVYYWFDERGRKLNENYSAKWYLLVDSIMKKRTDGALVRLTTPLSSTENETDAEKRMNDLLIASYDAIRNFIPGITP